MKKTCFEFLFIVKLSRIEEKRPGVEDDERSEETGLRAVKLVVKENRNQENDNEF
jgi:hypothetical protein